MSEYDEYSDYTLDTVSEYNLEMSSNFLPTHMSTMATCYPPPPMIVSPFETVLPIVSNTKRRRSVDEPFSTSKAAVREDGVPLKVARSGIKGRLQCKRCRDGKHGWFVNDSVAGPS